MEQQRIVVERFFLHVRVEVHFRSLLESHASLCLVLQVDVGNACMEPSVLAHGIALTARTRAQCRCSLIVSFGLEIAHAELVEGCALRTLFLVSIFFQLDDGVVVVARVVKCLAFNACCLARQLRVAIMLIEGTNLEEGILTLA